MNGCSSTALVSHIVPDGDLAQVLDDALRIAMQHRNRRKLGAATKSRATRVSTNPRHIPANVRRAVYERDGGRCTFIADDGHRCEARHHLHFDHIEPLARGGTSTADNIRLHCRAHNQFQAERTFGAGFMQAKRERAAEDARAKAEHERKLDVIAALRSLGYRAEQARHMAERTAAPDLTLEQHVRAALAFLRPTYGVKHEPAPSAARAV